LASAQFAQASPAWNSRIAFERIEIENAYTHGVYVMNSNGSRQTRLTDGEWPSWSPDGTQIAFSTTRDGNSEIYVMNADGTDPQRLTSNTAPDWDPAWSPDGTQIAFTSSRDTRPDGLPNGEI